MAGEPLRPQEHPDTSEFETSAPVVALAAMTSDTEKSCWMTYEEMHAAETVRRLAEDGTPVPPKEAMTCYRCPEADTCWLAWDLYNTNGDCLAHK